jgi:hypothetical protein
MSAQSWPRACCVRVTNYAGAISRAWSSQVVKRLEDDCGEDLRAAGFSGYLVDHEPGDEGA